MLVTPWRQTSFFHKCGPLFIHMGPKRRNTPFLINIKAKTSLSSFISKIHFNHGQRSQQLSNILAKFPANSANEYQYHTLCHSSTTSWTSTQKKKKIKNMLIKFISKNSGEICATLPLFKVRTNSTDLCP